MASQAASDTPQIKVFISYSRKDIAFADRLETALEKRDFEPLIDRTEIYAFEDWWTRIQSLIAQADTIVFLLSPESVSSQVCAKEVAFAASLNKRFAPVVIQAVENKLVPDLLSQLNFIFFDKEADFGESFDRLCDALRTNIDWIRKHTEYGEAARRWTQAGRPAGMLLRSPMLDQAEAWMAFRPSGAPAPSAETEVFIAVSRRAEAAARRRSNIINVALYSMLISIILGLVGWIKQDSLKEQWHWWTVERPHMLSAFQPYVLSAQREHSLKAGNPPFKECAQDCPEMVVLPPGKFMMGSPSGVPSSESPYHQVVINRAIAVSVSDVTFDEWNDCVRFGDCPKAADGGWGGGRRPVINVSWNGAKLYVAWLSKMTGKTYRLLSESEWEYAARAGTTTTYFWSDKIGTNNANCIGCGSRWDGQKPAPVNSFPPNRFGLYDMAGNVWQWVEDCYHEGYGARNDGSALDARNCDYRTVRGGSWLDNYKDVRSSFRHGVAPDVKLSRMGFRVSRTIGP